MFGHARGAFTGAVQSTEGKVAAAEVGTLFLDEIGDLPLTIQPKLLRLLQERLYERVGETKTRKADVRILAATNRDLTAEVASGRFREDLYYRLEVIEIELPPLRQRPRDLLPLAEHLLRFFARQADKTLTGFSDAAREAIVRHHWPGNLRELRNAIERGVILSPGPEVDLSHLPVRLAGAGGGASRNRRAVQPGCPGERTYPAGPGNNGLAGGGRGNPGHQSQYAVSQAQGVRAVVRLSLLRGHPG